MSDAQKQKNYIFLSKDLHSHIIIRCIEYISNGLVMIKNICMLDRKITREK